jgi:hypothetical protein
MKRPRKRTLLLGAVIALYGALVVSDHGVLFWLTESTRWPRPGAEEEHGVLRTFRCHYFTGTGTFSLESSMGFGAESCEPVKRQDPTLDGFARSRFA